MNKHLQFNVMSCLDKIYGRMNDNYNFAYPNGSFEMSRGHQVLCRFSVFSDTLTTLFDKENMSSSTEVDKVFFKQMLGNAKVIGVDKEWAYPNGNLAENRIVSTLNCIETSMKNYHSAIKLLGNYCFADKKPQFDVVHFIEKVSCLKFYNYAYPDNYYSETKAHAALQMLITITENVGYIVDSVVAPDKEVKTILANYSNKLNNAKDILLQAYPNNQFNKNVGHSCLSKFIESWKNAKEFCVPQLKTYFEKQQLIADYEAKLQQPNKADDDYQLETFLEKTMTVSKTPDVVEPPPTPVIRKLKSLL